MLIYTLYRINGKENLYKPHSKNSAYVTTITKVDDEVNFNKPRRSNKILKYSLTGGNFKSIRHISADIPTIEYEGNEDSFYGYRKSVVKSPLKFELKEIREPIRLDKITESKCVISKVKFNLKSEALSTRTEHEINASLVQSSIEGAGGLGDLKIVIEVLKGKIYRLEFPENFLTGMTPSAIATKVGKNTLQVRTVSYGNTIIYTDYGEINFRTVPGLRVE